MATTKPITKLDKSLHHIFDVVLELRLDYCIRLSLENDEIYTLQEMLILNKDDIKQL